MKSARPARWKFLLNGLLLLAPGWFFYASLAPEWPAEWAEQPVGPFTAAPMPLSDDPPIAYDGGYVKDFSFRFCEGCVARIRAAHVSVGPAPAPVPGGHEGVLHGSSLAQHVHVPFPAEIGPEDRLWLSVQDWAGAMHHVSWPLPAR